MINYREYIQTDGSKYAWDTGYAINSLNDEVYLDFMPLTGNPQGDAWFCYAGDDDKNIFIRSFYNQPNSQMGVSFGTYLTYIDSQTIVTANFNERAEVHLSKSVYENLTTHTSIALNATSLNSERNHIILNAESIRNNEAFRPMVARYYGFKVVNGNTTLVDLKPALDTNDNPCFYDEVSETYIYHTGSGTPIAGPAAHTLTVNPDSIRFEASGGTSAFTVTSETGWTCQASTAFTLSTLSGSSGDTIVSVTAANYTGATKIEEILTITDDDNYTVDITLRQKKYSAGVDSSLFMGEINIENLFLGDKTVDAMYLGEIPVFSSGPFVGLKLSPKTINFQKDSGLTANLKVKASEAWSLALPNDATWLSASTLTGDTGETTVVLSTVEEMTSGTSRNAVITATTANYSATCEVIQFFIHYVNYICTNPLQGQTNLYIETGIFPTTATTMRFKFTGTGLAAQSKLLGFSYGWEEPVYNWASDNTDYRVSSYADRSRIFYDYNESRLEISGSNALNENVYNDWTIGNYYMYDNINQDYIFSSTSKTVQATSDIPIMVNVSVIHLHSLEIWQGETKVFDGKAAIDDLTGHIGLYDSISDSLVYNSSLTMTYGE